MIVVIQCAGSKQPHAGRLRTPGGKPVAFVAQPDLAPHTGSQLYARPDDISDDGRTWRQVLLDYNKDGRNEYGLLAAYELYREPVYRRLAKQLSLEKVFILSAGWGLIRADFLTPNYDITFSQVKPDSKYKSRRKLDRYDDFAMIPSDTRDRIVLFGSKTYVSFFCELTREIRAEKIVFFNTHDALEAPGCSLRLFKGAKRSTNWQYDCANAFLDGELSV